MAGSLRLLLTVATACAGLLALPAAAGPEDAGRPVPATQHVQHLPLLLHSAGPAFPPQFRIAIDPTAHADYGLAYPVTYRFALPPGAANLAVYRRHTPDQPWTRLIAWERGRLFNGVEAVRFDYPASSAYVSVAFGGDSDDVYLAIVDAAGQPVPAQFVEIARYYDDRSAAVVVTGDDEMSGLGSHFQAAYQAFTAARVWFTPAINTAWISSAGWASIQSHIDQGYVEPACHSRTHPLLPYPDYDAEVGGCMQDIKDNLAVPYPRGAAEYVPAYVDPGGYSNADLRAALARHRYLVERSIHENVQDFAPWSAGDGLYERVGVTLCGDHRSLLELDTAFYWATQQRGIYHLYIHPWQHDWSDDSPIRQHIDHIKGRGDLWYVGFGHLYLYRFVQERGLVAVTPLAAQP